MTNLTLKDYKKDLEEINYLKEEKEIEKDLYMSKLYNINKSIKEKNTEIVAKYKILLDKIIRDISNYAVIKNLVSDIVFTKKNGKDLCLYKLKEMKNAFIFTCEYQIIHFTHFDITFNRDFYNLEEIIEQNLFYFVDENKKIIYSKVDEFFKNNCHISGLNNDGIFDLSDIKFLDNKKKIVENILEVGIDNFLKN